MGFVLLVMDGGLVGFVGFLDSCLVVSCPGLRDVGVVNVFD